MIPFSRIKTSPRPEPTHLIPKCRLSSLVIFLRRLLRLQDTHLQLRSPPPTFGNLAGITTINNPRQRSSTLTFIMFLETHVVLPQDIASSQANGSATYSNGHTEELIQEQHIPAAQGGNIHKPSSPLVNAYNPAANGYPAPPARQQSPVRATSPGSASLRSWGSSKAQSLIASPPFRAQEASYAAPPRSIYDPPIVPPSQRTSSPSVTSVRSLRSVHDPYAPTNTSDSSAARDRSMSNASLLSVASSVRDPYVPSLRAPSRQQSIEETVHGPSLQQAVADSSFTPSSYIQVLPIPSHMGTAYAPSPSLLGTNDPLGRTSVRIPVVSFGFGGKVVTCFHGSSYLNTGFDVALSSRPSTDVHLRVLHRVIPESALDVSSAQFPGPLFSDPGTPSTSIIGNGVAAQTKAKKARVVKYLEERIEEMSPGTGYLQQWNFEGQHAQAKEVLIKLLKVMVENDGRLSGR